ncbi:hypothetical protein B0O99DRAFT_642033 [Bisporella sp. PMI_857]|nr:hypothetical protein B0O99DRAFT_642033 [Bisporella sp. PMI_857]
MNVLYKSSYLCTRIDIKHGKMELTSKKRQLLPHELFLHIRSFLPHLSKHLVTHAWRLWRKDEVEEHSTVWNKIFKEDTWLCAVVKLGYNPVLIGYDIERFYKGHKGRYYLALALAHDGDGGRSKPGLDELTGLLGRCLRDAHVARINSVSEYYFPKLGLTLNAHDALYGNRFTLVSDPGELVGQPFIVPKLFSAYLYWKDDTFKVRKIKPKKILGIGKSSKKNANYILGLEMKYFPSGLPSTESRKYPPRQHYFLRPGVEWEVDEIWSTDRKGLTGWKWKKGRNGTNH